MFTVFVQDSSGDIVMQFNQCRHFDIIPYQRMAAEYPDILLKHGGMECSYLPLWKWGYSTATAVHDPSRASSYICKCITKELTCSLKNQRRFIYSQNLDMPVERVYNCDYDVLSNLMKKYISLVDYVKTVRVAKAGQKITYMEFNKTTGFIPPSR